MHFVSGEAGIRIDGIVLDMPVGLLILGIGLMFCLMIAMEGRE